MAGGAHTGHTHSLLTGGPGLGLQPKEALDVLRLADVLFLSSRRQCPSFRSTSCWLTSGRSRCSSWLLLDSMGSKGKEPGGGRAMRTDWNHRGQVTPPPPSLLDKLMGAEGACRCPQEGAGPGPCALRQSLGTYCVQVSQGVTRDRRGNRQGPSPQEAVSPEAWVRSAHR